MVLFFLTRLPAMAHYFTIDNVNLALALEKFDPRIHQPQPPGYPLFVVFNRIVNFFFHDATKTFLVTGLLVSALCLPLAFGVGKRLFGPWVGRASVLLLLVTPPFWYASLEGPLRPHLAFFSLLTAYCCWRCWNGEESFALWGAVAVGVGAGFRPDLGVFLFPMWLLSSWMGTRSVVSILKAGAVMAAVVLVWIGGMAYAVGGFHELYKLNVDYVVEQSKQQGALGAVEKAWLRQISRLVIWNATALLAAIWAIPFVIRSRDRVSLLSGQTAFMVAWLLPGLLFQVFVHIGDPGHTLFSIPAIAILAAYLIFAGTQRFIEIRDAFLAGAVVINSALFLGFLTLPASAQPAGGLSSLKNSFLFATFETSIGELRYQDDTARSTMVELGQFTPQGVPFVIVSSDTTAVNWFMNWRIARYYMPGADIWVLGDLRTPHFVQHVRRDKTDPIHSVLQVPIPKGGRIIWLLEKDGPFHRALKQSVRGLGGGNYVWYTDVNESGPLRVMDFEFVPDTH